MHIDQETKTHCVLSNKKTEEGNAIKHNHDEVAIEIANISFGYANRKLIKLLKQRGTALNAVDIKKINGVEK